MIIATRFAVDFDVKRGVFFIVNWEAPVCPDCDQILSGYDGRRRHVIDSSGAVLWFRLRRLRCPDCKKLHIELPDFMVPQKHYEGWVIDEALAGRFEACPADDSTIRRWKKK
ncbi:MAG: DUF6431 domain-containing protein [Bacillota bacterium]|nr:DUF6431 domain-containing protein [Bacillota bacterium]